MKTLLFTLEYPPFKGGVANYYGNLVKFYPRPDELVVLDNNDNKLLRKWLFPRWYPACSALRKAIKKNKIKHVIVGNILPLGTIAMSNSIFRNIPYTVILHGMDFSFSQKTWRKRFLSKIILRRAKNIICANSYTADLVKKIVSNHDEIHVVNPGVNEVLGDQDRVEEIRKKYQLEDKRVMLTVGRLVKRKGQDMVLDCLPVVTKKVPNLVYVVAGDGPDKKYLEKKAEGQKNVLFLGKISEEDKQAWLALCDFFIMPSRNIKGDFEGFGIVYLEAAIHAKPVIGGQSGGVGDAVQNAVTGILVNPEDKDRLVDVITKLAIETDTRRLLGQNARERVVKNFRWEDKIEAIYKIVNRE